MNVVGQDNKNNRARRTSRPHYIPIVVGPDRDFGGVTDALVAVVHDPANPRAYEDFKELLTQSLRRGSVGPTPQQVAHLVTTYLSIYMHRVGHDRERSRTGLQVARVEGRPIVLVDVRALQQPVDLPAMPVLV